MVLIPSLPYGLLNIIAYLRVRVVLRAQLMVPYSGGGVDSVFNCNHQLPRLRNHQLQARVRSRRPGLCLSDTTHCQQNPSSPHCWTCWRSACLSKRSRTFVCVWRDLGFFDCRSWFLLLFLMTPSTDTNSSGCSSLSYSPPHSAMTLRDKSYIDDLA